MEEEFIDLRVYVKLLFEYWFWIVGAAVLAAVTAFAVSSLMAPSYEAESVVLITEPRYMMQFEPRFETMREWEPAYPAFPVLATSDEMLQAVVDAYTPTPDAGIETWTLKAVKGMTDASSEGDPSLVILRVTSSSPEDAAAVANLWASLLVRRGNAIYRDVDQDVDFFAAQLATAGAELAQVEAALVAFEAQNEHTILDAQLHSLRRTQSDYLTDQRTIAYLIQDLEGLGTQMARQPGTQIASLGDDLTTLYLQIKAFNADATAPIEMQINTAESLSKKSVTEQIAFLEDLIETLEAKSDEIDERLEAVEPEILALQERLQIIETERTQLTRDRNLMEETYMTLARKLEEARIAAQEESGILQVGSHAAVPEEPTGPRRLVNTALAGVVGGMVAVGAVFALDWWQAGEETEHLGRVES
jgi:polysaccharide biosynthesis transport protein